MVNYEEGFTALAKAFSGSTLPVDSANWDIWQPPKHDATIMEILDHFVGSSAAMPADVCELLSVPLGTTYARGAERIWGFAGPSMKERIS